MLLNTGRYGDKRPWLLLSLGAGQIPPSASIENVENTWGSGLLGWAAPLVDIVFSDPGVDAKEIMDFGEYYFRLQPWTLTAATADLDNAIAIFRN